MSEFQENKDLEKEIADTQDSEDFESTIFSNPEAHKEKKKTSKKGFLLKIISAFLVVALLVGGTFAVIKLIPEKEEGTGEDIKQAISVLSNLSKDVAEVNISNKNGEFKLYPTKEVIDEKNTTVWHLDGIDSSLTESSVISNIATNAMSLSASREIDPKDRPLSDFGLDTPVATATVKFADKTEGYSVMIGKASPDNSGTYLKVSNKDKIYVVDTTVTDAFTFEAIDLGNAQAFAPATFEGDISKYLNDSGIITTFDYITVSGERFPQKLTVEPYTSDIKSVIVSYITTTPINRYADNIEALISPFSNGITVTGSYSFDMSQESLKKFRLDKPDIILSMSINSQVKTFKISMVDDAYCAVINEDSKQIKKVALTALTVSDLKIEDCYNKWIFMEQIKELSNFTLNTDGKVYSFDIEYNADDEENEYVITCNGNKITASKFQEFYGEFSILKTADFSTVSVNTAPSATIDITFLVDGEKVKLDFYKVSETKYQYSKNGVPMGKISSLDYNKLIKNIKSVSQDKAIS